MKVEKPSKNGGFGAQIGHSGFGRWLEQNDIIFRGKCGTSRTDVTKESPS